MDGIVNVKITDTQISMADHGCLTFWLILEGNGWGIGFGGYCIGHGYLNADEFKAESGDGLEAMMMIMDVVGVERWEDLKGKLIRAELDGNKCHRIGNIMKNKWFDIEEFFKSKNEEKRKGKWINCLHASENDIFVCSLCEKEFGYDTDFCPHCGADMRGEE